MAHIFRADDSTLYLCDGCLRDLGPIPGKWNETPMEECSVCGEIDLQSREEMDAYHHDMNNLQYEEDYFVGDAHMNAAQYEEERMWNLEMITDEDKAAIENE